MSDMKLELPEGVERADFKVSADSMSNLGRAVEVLLGECDYNLYRVEVDSLGSTCTHIKAMQEGIVGTSWGPWTCRITVWRRWA